MEQAARVTSSVQHGDHTVRAVASVTGLVAGVVIVIVTRGRGFKMAVKVASWTKKGGKFLDKQLDRKTASEKIEKGVEHVILEEAKHPAANVSAKTRTDQHKASPAVGSDSVFIENCPASRRGDSVACGGLIIDGAPHILIGGEQTSTGEEPEEDLPMWLKIVEATIDVASKVSKKDLLTKRGRLKKLAKARRTARKLGVL